MIGLVNRWCVLLQVSVPALVDPVCVTGTVSEELAGSSLDVRGVVRQTTEQPVYRRTHRSDLAVDGMEQGGFLVLFAGADFFLISWDVQYMINKGFNQDPIYLYVVPVLKRLHQLLLLVEEPLVEPYQLIQFHFDLAVMPDVHVPLDLAELVRAAGDNVCHTCEESGCAVE
jgi:hypothetical protein